MELLDYHYADEKVRTMAVAAVERLLNDDELDSFLLQLVQVLILIHNPKKSQPSSYFQIWYLNAVCFCEGNIAIQIYKHNFINAEDLSNVRHSKKILCPINLGKSGCLFFSLYVICIL